MHKKDSTSAMDTDENEWMGIRLEAAGVDRDLLNFIKRRILSYFGHVVITEWDRLEKLWGVVAHW